LLSQLALCTLAVSTNASITATPDQTYVANGVVNAITIAPSGTAFIGGKFTQVGPRTGPGVGIEAIAGADAGLPQVSGGGQTVHAVLSDGSGGWYIGGDFTHVGGVERHDIAHITAEGTVDPSFDPNADGEVDALAASGSTVYAGGQFSSIGGQARRYLAALSASTGSATSWNPNPNEFGFVLALAASGSTVYAGGDFTTIGTNAQERSHLAALNAAGEATGWNPDANARVRAIALSGAGLYAGGDFTTIGENHATRSYLAALETPIANATGWKPDPNEKVEALAVSGSNVYAAGTFSRIGTNEAQRANLGAVNASTGAATSWNPEPAGGGFVDALAVWGSTVYAGGEFSSIGGQARNNLAALDVSTAKATSWNPDTNNPVLALAAAGSTVYAGGDFSSIGGVSRHDLAALDASGEVTGWNPGADGEIAALALSGSTVYVGGSFATIGVNNKERHNVAALETASGNATEWNPNANEQLFALAVSGSTVYAGGGFTTIGANSKERKYVAALDTATGDATEWNPNADQPVYALAVSGSTVYAGGAFSDGGVPGTTIGEADRNHIAALEASTGKATSWNPNADDLIYALVVNGPTVYAGGRFTTVGGATRLRLAALETSSGQATSWDPSSDDAVEAIAVSGSNVYAAGDFSTIGGEGRRNLAALDASTGHATSWNPDPDLHANDGGEALAASGTTVYVGGIWSGYESAPQQGIARFSEPTSPPTVTALEPSSGPGAGGNSVKITGTNLSAATKVRFGMAEASTFSVKSAAEITATAPPGSGTVDVSVRTPGGTSPAVPADRYTYVPAPAVSGVSPKGGPTVGGTPVTITGTNLSGATAVNFGATPASSFEVDSATQITAISPAGATGVAHVTVTTIGGTSGTSAADDFTYLTPQTVSFTSTAPSGPLVGETYSASASATSGLPVVLTIDAGSTPGACSISGATVSFTGSGSCLVDANQAGNETYAPAAQVQQSIVVKRPQTITFTSTPAEPWIHGAYTPTATASSGLDVLFSIDPRSASEACDIEFGPTVVAFAAVGTCIIDANQGGSATYAPAPQVQQSITVTLAPQSVIFVSTPPSPALVGQRYSAVAEERGLSDSPALVVVSIDASSTPGACLLMASESHYLIGTLVVGFTGTGTCVIDANKEAAFPQFYLPAPQVQQSILIKQLAQTIQFTAPATGTVGQTVTVSASPGASGNPVSFTVDSSSGSGVCTVSGTTPSSSGYSATVTFTGSGSCVIDAGQPGNAQYLPAPTVKQSITVKRNQAIAFAPLGNRTTVQTPFLVTARASSGLPVTFTASPKAVCTAGGTNGRSIALHGPGTCTVTANQAGNVSYWPAPAVSRSFCVYRPKTVAACVSASGSSIGVQASVPSAGTLSATATTSSSSAVAASVTLGSIDRGLRFGSAKLSVRHAGQVQMTIKPTAAGRSLLARVKRLRVSVTLTFTPSHGRATTRHTFVTLTAAQ
jgi:hypothetical protein